MPTIERYFNLIEAEIRKMRFGERPFSLYEPIRYMMGLGGKRLRPMLTMLTYSLYKNDIEKIVKYAVAVEGFHNFTLMHDDIMDKATLRRGKRTVHEKWNTSTAILAGDVMMVKVYDILSGLEPQKLKEVMRLFNTCAASVCEGQQLDMEFETRKKVSEKEYLEMIQLKTAVLLGFSMELGATLAGASDKDRAILRDCGVNLGMGFQLKDDWLDIFANQKKFGKQVGGDIVVNKKTFLLIKAIEMAKGAEKKELNGWVAAKKFDSMKKIKSVKTIYNNLGIGELTENKAGGYFEVAAATLKSLQGVDKSRLVEFSNDLVKRQR